ncbi:hypothetical protein Emin_0429 [Elusimicrobium minutum Pei191]|uniref:Haem-binding uptake Tiki superfamily ChaN domain-containing protein n=1 Tax=Elusimicrobium minutum (strain Pei191) TaxID=445932 RepID=B2KBG4_ELUMP|nr:hypothetical protein [Elusimicrobium minutum]ACC97986.1 hypothetical protein Emin_0429 [Elusimicrobium minutum Pei191]
MKKAIITLVLILMVSVCQAQNSATAFVYPGHERIEEKLKIYQKEFELSSYTDPFIRKDIDTKATAETDSLINGFLRSSLTSKNIKHIPYGIDYSKFIPKDTKVVLVGETHGYGFETHMESIIKSLRSAGKNPYFATEFLSSEANAWLAAAKKEKNKNYLDFVAISEEAFPILEAFDDLTVIGLEVPEIFNDRQMINAFCIHAALFCALHEGEIADTKADLACVISAAEATAYRNRHWINVLDPYLRNSEPVVIYGGIGHMYYGEPSGSLADRLVARDIKTVVIYMFSKKQLDQDLKEKFKQEAVVKIPSGRKSELGIDYVIIID